MSGWDWYTLVFTTVVGVMLGYALWTIYTFCLRYRWCKQCRRRGHRKWLFLGTHKTHRWYIRHRIKKARRNKKRWTSIRNERTNR